MTNRKLLSTTAIFFLGVTAIAPLAQAAEPVWDGNKVEMISQEMAPGVYAYYPSDAADLNTAGGPAATSGGLIAGSTASLLIETMLNERLYDQVLALAGSAPTFAVNTSAHGDHSYGNMYLPDKTAIIQHVGAKAYVDQHLADDKAFMIQNFGAGRGIEEITARTGEILVPAGGSMTLDLGDKTVEIIDFGFAQTGGDLFVWEPQSKVMWTGNAIVAAKPALPWLLGGHLVATLDTLTKVYDFLPADARIIPGHGVPITREDLKWHIDYLAAVKAGVEAAIADGKSLEEAVAAVKLDEFRGYALFNWVHPGLNVPAAYKDLSN